MIGPMIFLIWWQSSQEVMHCMVKPLCLTISFRMVPGGKPVPYKLHNSYHCALKIVSLNAVQAIRKSKFVKPHFHQNFSHSDCFLVLCWYCISELVNMSDKIRTFSLPSDDFSNKVKCIATFSKGRSAM